MWLSFSCFLFLFFFCMSVKWWIVCSHWRENTWARGWTRQLTNVVYLAFEKIQSLCWNLSLRFVQILRFVCVGNQTNLSLLLVSVDLFRIRHVKVCTGRLGLGLPPLATYSNVCMTAWGLRFQSLESQTPISTRLLPVFVCLSVACWS